MIKDIITLSLLMCFCCSCSDSDDGKKDILVEYQESYIQWYFTPDRISILERVNLQTDESALQIIPDNFDNINAEENAGKYYSLRDQIFFQVEIYSTKVISRDTDKKRYEELRDRIADNSFNREIAVGIAGTPVTALTEKIHDVKVTVREPYNPDYPGGSDVTALFTVYYEHPYSVVKNRYEAPAGTYRMSTRIPGLPQAIYKDGLDRVDFSTKTALGNEFMLLLNKSPEKTGTYTFTVQVTTAEGDILTVDTAPIPIKVE